jgi:hypothetical protein
MEPGKFSNWVTFDQDYMRTDSRQNKLMSSQNKLLLKLWYFNFSTTNLCPYFFSSLQPDWFDKCFNLIAIKFLRNHGGWSMVRMILRALIPLCVVNICFTHSLPKRKSLMPLYLSHNNFEVDWEWLTACEQELSLRWDIEILCVIKERCFL